MGGGADPLLVKFWTLQSVCYGPRPLSSGPSLKRRDLCQSATQITQSYLKPELSWLPILQMKKSRRRQERGGPEICCGRSLIRQGPPGSSPQRRHPRRRGEEMEADVVPLCGSHGLGLGEEWASSWRRSCFWPQQV